MISDKCLELNLYSIILIKTESFTFRISIISVFSMKNLVNIANL